MHLYILPRTRTQAICLHLLVSMCTHYMLKYITEPCFQMVALMEIQWNLGNPTPEFSNILWHPTIVFKLNQSILTSCTIWHISLVAWCVGLDRFHCTCFFIITNRCMGNPTPEFSNILWHPTIVFKLNQSILTSCTIWHISLVAWCVGLDRFHCTCFFIITNRCISLFNSLQ